MLKAFWGGPSGWRDRQHQDGTIDWIAPDGQTYHTTPGGRLLFPELCAPTAPVTTTGPVPPAHTSGLRMPRRTTTRAEHRARRIHDERELKSAAAEPEDEPPF
ncbi:hypothetical protein [Mycolicibacterium hodleri]|uniref:HNH endonuclease n=1 Tax=Mycolicibacterium hodleri TaxID=49897 RepID=A0A502E3E4_9MYCO|nr:hypothetical protein [Mycolicibacterium hodleri]TPG32215.1 hypothetical protein EAH80_20570 [Mycolicibacterium hodleri]